MIKLPVLPSSIGIDNPMNNQVFESVSLGSLKTIGLRGLKSMEIESFFPSKDYPFLRDRTYMGWEYIQIIESWMEKRVPIRLVITDTPINLPMSIESISYSQQDGTRDIYYTLTLEEFKLIDLQKG